MKSGFVDFDLSNQEISKQWYPKVWCFVRKTKLPHLEQSDLVQELMLHLFNVSQKFRLGQSTFNTFAWTCLKNKVRTLIKQNKKEQVLSSDDNSWKEIEFELDCQMVSSRSLNQKQAFVLSFLNQGYKKSEIANKMKVTESRISGLIKELTEKRTVREMLGVVNV